MWARKYFYIFRNYMHEDLLWNWWTEEVSNYLQDFYDDCVAGKRPKLAIEGTASGDDGRPAPRAYDLPL